MGIVGDFMDKLEIYEDRKRVNIVVSSDARGYIRRRSCSLKIVVNFDRIADMATFVYEWTRNREVTTVTGTVNKDRALVSFVSIGEGKVVENRDFKDVSSVMVLDFITYAIKKAYGICGNVDKAARDIMLVFYDKVGGFHEVEEGGR